MTASIVTRPAVPLMTLADAKEHLRITGTDEDGYVGGLVSDVEGYLDAEHGVLGRAFITQTWDEAIDGFPESRIDLPFAPVQSITSITYYDTANAAQTLAASNYSLVSANDQAFIQKASAGTWPETYDRPDAVTVRYVCGYGDAPTDLPQQVLRLVRLLVAHWDGHRSAASDRSAVEVPMAAQMIMSSLRTSRGLY